MLHRRKPLKRKAPLEPRSPLRSTRVPSKPRRVKNPGRDFWATQRETIAARAGYACEHCGANLNVTGLEAHHRKLRSQGGRHGVDNLAALCPESHRWVHANPSAAVLLGFICPRESNPAMRAVVLHDGRTVRLNTDGSYDLCWDDSEEGAA